MRNAPKPFKDFYLDVGDGHSLYVSHYGNPNGVPVIYLHGGPGAGCTPSSASIFNLEHYHVVLFDQRGSGLSRPYADVANNNIDALIKDIETIRKHMGFKKVLLVGGSWGSSLAMLYAAQYADNISGIVLRGQFFADKQGANIISGANSPSARYAPDHYQNYLDFAAKNRIGDEAIDITYDRILSLGQNDPLAIEAHRLFCIWDTAIASKTPRTEWLEPINRNPAEDFSLSRIYMHYAVNEFRAENKELILKTAANLTSIPIALVHGRYDWICPVENAYKLQEYMPTTLDLRVVEGGHTVGDSIIADALADVLTEWQSHPSLPRL